MATEVIDTNKIETLFSKLEAQKTILSTCTNLYKTLTSHFTSLENSITTKSETLETKIQSLDSNFEKSLENLHNREKSIPERLISLSSEVESKKQAAIAEFQKLPSDDSPLVEVLRSLCKRMDHSMLLRLVVTRRKEANTLRAEMKDALNMSVDPPRLVINVVKEFVDLKAKAKAGLTDKRWACAMVVGGMFAPDELKEKRESGGPEFSRMTVERAENVVREWRETAEKVSSGSSGGGGEELNGMGPAEASIFLQIVIGFGLKEKFGEEFCKKMVMEFANRRDMPKLAMALYGDKIGDIIDELVKNGKEVEAVYFATEAGLTERFQPVSLLKSSLRTSKDKASDILKKGHHSSAAKDEAQTYEIHSIKYIIKCVEDHKIESEFSLESLKKRLASLEKNKAEKKKASAAAPRPSNKRGYVSGAARSSGPPHPRPAKMTKYSSPYPPSYGQRNPVSPAQQSPVSRYLGPYNYPSQSTYDAGLSSSSYAPSYGGSHIPASSQISQQHYALPDDGVGAVGSRLGGSYGGQVGYGSYDYSAVAPPAYQPPSYT